MSNEQRDDMQQREQPEGQQRNRESGGRQGSAQPESHGDTPADPAGAPGTPHGTLSADQVSEVAGAAAVGGTGLGSAATADDMRRGTASTPGAGSSPPGAASKP